MSKTTEVSSCLAAILFAFGLTFPPQSVHAAEWAKLRAAYARQQFQSTSSRNTVWQAAQRKRLQTPASRNEDIARKVRGAVSQHQTDAARTRRIIERLYGRQPNSSAVNGYKTLKQNNNSRDPNGVKRLAEPAPKYWLIPPAPPEPKPTTVLINPLHFQSSSADGNSEESKWKK